LLASHAVPLVSRDDIGPTVDVFLPLLLWPCTDKKENQIFLIYKEIQGVAVAKSFMTNGLLIQYMGKYLRISSYIRKPFPIYDFATAPLWISLYMRKIWFTFLSV
jgi:hypothetical protein